MEIAPGMVRMSTRKCGTCEGTGKVDSGAPDLWGNFYEVGCPECNGSGRVELRGPVRVADELPEIDEPVLTYCADGQYRTARYAGDDGWYMVGDPWMMHGKEAPVYWWELPEVAHE